MTTRVQTLRSSLKGVRPAGGSREVGELYVNFADWQIGMINAAKAPVDLVAVRFFAVTSDYAAGDYVVQSGQLYRALNSVTAGAFNPPDWVAVSIVPADLLASIKLVDGTGSGLDADLLDGLDSTAFATSASVAAVYAPLASPVFTGDPKAVTQLNTDADTSIATTQFVKSVRLDMFASPFASVGMNGQLITSLATPVNPTDAATKAYVDATSASLSGYLPLTGGTLTGDLLSTTGVFGASYPSSVMISAGAPGNPRNIAFRPLGKTIASGEVLINGSSMTVDGGISASSTVTAGGGDFVGSTTRVRLATPGGSAGTISFRPNGLALGTNEVSLTSAGVFTLAQDPSTALGAATKQYVDAGVNSKIGEAPNDGLQYGRKNADWTEIVAQAYGSTHNYTFNVATTTPPATGSLRFNNTTQPSATAIYINYTTNDTIAINLKTYFLARVNVGDTFYFQDKDDPTKWQLFRLNATFTDNGTYASLPVSWLAGGSALTAARIIVSREGAGVSSPVGEAPNDGSGYVRKSQAWAKEAVQGGKITIASTAPASPAVNDVWIDTT